ncbi:MAG: Hsp20/alpha crystallin family protein [Treponema sp.]|nr:Hsp20/alpha crystallin family protein [Treponema sp.]
MNEIVEKKQEQKIRTVQPACSICEDNGQVQVRLEMPGVDKDGIEVSVEKNELVIKGRPTINVTEGTYLIRERQTGEYHKRFIIDETIDRDKIQAVMNDGILQITLSVKEAAKPRRIEIK